jgi:hypothetical protein
MASNKTKHEKLENIRNYSIFIGLTFLIVFYMRDEGKNFWMGVSLSIIPFGVGAYATYWLTKNRS